MKKIISILILLTIVIGSAFASGQDEKSKDSNTVEQKIVFKVAVNNPESHAMGQSWKKFGELLESETDGRLSLDIYYGGQLGSKTVCLQGLQTGVIDMYMIMPSVLCDYGAEDLKVFSLPYIFSSLEHARAFTKSDEGEKLLNYIQSSGTRMVGLGYFQDLPRNYFFKDKKVTKVEDLEGLKIRSQASSIDLETMKAFGASPVTVAFSELYSALQTGVVDGAEQPFTGFYSNQFQEVAKYMVLDGHQIAPSIGLISEIAWNKLSDSDRAIIKKCFLEASEYWDTLIDEAETELDQAIRAAGVNVFEAENPEDWRAKVQPVYDMYGEQFKDTIDAINTLKY